MNGADTRDGSRTNPDANLLKQPTIKGNFRLLKNSFEFNNSLKSSGKDYSPSSTHSYKIFNNVTTYAQLPQDPQQYIMNLKKHGKPTPVRVQFDNSCSSDDIGSDEHS